MLKMAMPRVYLVVFNHACQQVRSQHLDDMLSSMQGGAVLEGVLYSDGLGRALVLHWRRILHYSEGIHHDDGEDSDKHGT